MADPRRSSAYLHAFLDRDVIPLLARPAGHGARRTIATPCWRRFANPAVNDQLAAHHLRWRARRSRSSSATRCAPCLAAGGDHRRLAFLLAAFARYLAGRDDRGATFEPLEPHLTAADRALATAGDPRRRS